MASEATTTDHGNGVATQQLVDAVQLAVSHLSQQQEVESEAASTSGSGEPPAKRSRSDSEGGEFAMDQSIKQILFNINKAICLRLDAIENKLETVSIRCKYLEEKVEQIVGQMKQTPGVVVNPSLNIKRSGSPPRMPRSGAVIVGLPQEREPPDSPQSNSSMSPMDHSLHNLGPNVTLITLNTEEDFPSGTWLGDENNPEMRVRVPVTPSDLLHVHSNCRTPEKMALTLLDYLFDRETQACSNLSGMGKHGKKQLDPLMIYGIRCHLIHKFGITEQDWHRIKQNIDSKCRTAFRRKLRGLSLTVKAFRGKAPSTYVQMQSPGQVGMGAHGDGTLSGEDTELHIAQGEVEMQGVPGIMQPHQAAELLQSGEIQVLHATPEQVAQLQQAHQIQILQGDTTQVLQTLQGGDGQDGIHVAVSMAQPDGIHVVTTDIGETIQINQVNQGPEADAEDTPSQESEQEPDQ